jgi:type IV pilus secretin PilQ/predicted competence protein
MTKNIIRLTAFGVGIALALAGFSQTGSSPVPVKMTILPTRVNTRVVLEGVNVPAGFSPVYQPGRDAVLVFDLGRIAAPPTSPVIPADEPPLIRDVKFLPVASGGTTLSLTLLERVPFRSWIEGTKTIIELIKIQRGGGDYLIAPEAQAELNRIPRASLPLSYSDPADRGDRLDVGAKIGRKAIVNVFALDNPLRLVIDVFDAVIEQTTSTVSIGKHGVEKVKIGQFKTGSPYSITRIVFDLREPRVFALANGADGLNIRFADPTAAAPVSPVSTPVTKPVEAAANVAPKTEPKPVNPSPADKKTAPAVIPPAKPETKAEVKPVETKAVPPKEQAAVKTNPVSLPLEDKKTPPAVIPPAKPETKAEVKPVETKAVPPKEQAVVKLNPVSPPATIPPAKPETKAEIKPVETKPAPPKEQVAVVPDPVTPPPADEEQKTITPKPRVDPAGQYADKTIYDPAEKYSGALISPRFKDADLRDVVLWLGDRVNLNVLFDNEVRGRTVTCSFVDVPWDQFLDMILKSNKLGRVLEGNVLRIAPIGVLGEEEKAQLTLRNAMEASGPLLTKTYSLSYATARDIFEIVKNKKSERGEIVVDIRTNALIVSDVKEKLDLIDQIISTLDAATPQVTIETRIIEVTSTFVRNLGIQWGAKAVADPFYGNQTALQFPNKALIDGALIPEGIVTKGISGPLGGYAINLPAPAFSSAVGFSLANVLDTFRVDLAISAMETEGNGKIVSIQRLTAQNNKEAYLNQGRQIPVQTQANFTVTTQYVNAGLELKATPQITAEGTIIMTLDIQNNAADFGNLVNGIPPITTQSAKTTVMVPDGGTTVIGGVYRVEDSVSRDKVPFLHQIPILGSLIKNLAKNRSNRELLIFITPRIQK